VLISGLLDARAINFGANGFLYVAEFYGHRIKKIDPATGGSWSIVGSGTAGFAGDGGLATLAELHKPVGVAADKWGNVFIADSENARIRLVTVLAATTVFDNTTAGTFEDSSISISLSGIGTYATGWPNAIGDSLNLTYALASAPANGSASLSSNTLTYTPAANFNGPDSLTFTASAGIIASPPNQVSLWINAVNDVPSATAQTVSGVEDDSLSIILAGSDADGDSLTYALVSSPAHGSASLSSNTVTYTPASNYNGTDSFTFTASDDSSTSSPATVSILINDTPTAAGQSVSADVNTTLSITLTGNDADGDSLAYALASAPSSGSASLSGNTITYTPALTLAGTYTTSNNALDVAVSGNYAYVAVRTSGLEIIDISTPSNPSIVGTYNTTGDAIGVAVRGNHAYVADSGSGLQIIDISTPSSPSLASTFNTSGSARNVVVSGNYAYVADSDSGLQIIDISTPSSPTLMSTYNTGFAYGVDVSGNYAYVACDTVGLRIVDISTPSNPSLAGTFNTSNYAVDVVVSGNHAYVADFEDGLDIIDISTPSSPSLVANYNTTSHAWGVTVGGNYAYVADGADGLYSIDISTPSSPSLVANYNTIGNAFDVILSGNYAYVADTAGGLTIISYNGNDSFTFTVSDHSTTSSPATVSVAIEAVNDVPSAIAQTVSGAEDGALSIILSGSDDERDILTYALVSAPAHGSASLSGNTVTYTPSANYNGTDSFTFTASDDSSTSSPATVSLAIAAVNDVPSATAQSVSAAINSSQPIILGGSDPDGDSLTYTLASGPANGSTSLNGNTLIYTPSSNYNGVDTLTFTVSDSATTSTPATVWVSVGSVNDASIDFKLVGTADRFKAPGVLNSVWSNGASSLSIPLPFLSDSPSLASSPGQFGTPGITGDGERVYAASADSIPVSASSVTLEAWFRPSGPSVAEADPIVLTDGHSENAVVVFWQDSKIHFFTDRASCVTYNSYADSVWYHVAATSDTTEMKLYVDGQLVSTAATSGTSGTFNSSVAMLGDPRWDYYTEGDVDEVRVWNYARSESQILALMNQEVTASAGGLLFHGAFNEAGAAPVLDQSQTVGGAGAGSTLNWQSFVAGETGLLKRVEMMVGSPLSGQTSSAVLRIREGEGDGGTLLHEQSLTLEDLNATYQGFDLNADVLLSESALYSFILEVPSINVGFVYLNVSNAYADGRSGHSATADMLFKTYMGPTPSAMIAVGDDTSLGAATLDTSLFKLDYTIAANDSGYVGTDTVTISLTDGTRSFHWQQPVQITPAAQLDQAPYISGATLSSDTTWWQSFTPGIGGALAQLRFNADSPLLNNSPSPATLKITAGSAGTGMLIHEQEVEILPGSVEQQIWLSELVILEPSVTYSWNISVPVVERDFLHQSASGNHVFETWMVTELAPPITPAIALMNLANREYANWSSLPLFSNGVSTSRDHDGSGVLDINDFIIETDAIAAALQTRRHIALMQDSLDNISLSELFGGSSADYWSVANGFSAIVQHVEDIRAIIYADSDTIFALEDVEWPGHPASYSGSATAYFADVRQRLDILSDLHVVPTFEKWDLGPESSGDPADSMAYHQLLDDLTVEVESTDGWQIALFVDAADGAGGMVFAEPLDLGVSDGPVAAIEQLAVDGAMPPVPPVGALYARLISWSGAMNGAGTYRDFFSNAQAQVQEWELAVMTPVPGDYTLFWSRLPTEGGFILTSDCGLTLDMRTVGMYDPNGNTCPTLYVTYYPEAIVHSLHGGWNLLSFPIAGEPGEDAIADIFPSAPLSVFSFVNGLYETTAITTAMEPGRGYWVNLPIGGVWNVIGEQVSDKNVSVNAGWQIIGAFDAVVDVAELQLQNPAVQSMFGYDSGGYYFAEQMEPGKGYWANLGAAVTIDFLALEGDSTSVATKPVVARSTAPAMLVASTDDGKEQQLQLGADFVYHLPPRPPAGTFDIRIHDDSGNASWGVQRKSLSTTHRVTLQAIDEIRWVVPDSLAGVWQLELDGDIIALDGQGRLEIQPRQQEALLRQVSQASIPAANVLVGNFPNPFNPQTHISYGIAAVGRVQLTIYDVLGRRVRNLVDERQEPGHYQMAWDAKDEQGRAVASGVYFYRLQIDSFSKAARMTLIR
jgi:hypothetical protein